MLTFRANGKLLLSAEYLVIDGATALATPTSFGQKLNVLPSTDNFHSWKSFDDKSNCWLSATFDEFFNCKEKNNFFLENVLIAARNISRVKFDSYYSFESHLDFPQNWGLGSSSTLIFCIAEFFKINPFELHFAVSKGSGYDIACASSNEAITYTLTDQQPIIEKVQFHPEFSENLFFIHLNQKQNSEKEVANYSALKKQINIAKCCETVSELTQNMIEARQLSYFEETVLKHEFMLSGILERNTIKENLFPYYKGGIIKSLGAWGGDFIMVTGKKCDLAYFQERGYTTILPFSEIII